MNMIALHHLFPDVATEECRSVVPVGIPELPKRSFAFVEAYCREPGCECRRVMLNVIDTERDEQVATISYGFDPPEPQFEEEGQAFLDPLNPQSDYSEALLGVFRNMIEHDEAYRQRLERHYVMWKQVVDDPKHPAHEKLRSSRRGHGLLPSPQPIRRAAPKIGANAPCPCGSGKKYKKCCRP